jgi:hypothetical protein
MYILKLPPTKNLRAILTVCECLRLWDGVVYKEESTATVGLSEETRVLQ